MAVKEYFLETLAYQTFVDRVLDALAIPEPTKIRFGRNEAIMNMHWNLVGSSGKGSFMVSILYYLHRPSASYALTDSIEKVPEALWEIKRRIQRAGEWTLRFDDSHGFRARASFDEGSLCVPEEVAKRRRRVAENFKKGLQGPMEHSFEKWVRTTREYAEGRRAWPPPISLI